MIGELMQFGSDVGLRARLFERASFSHPAKLHLGVLQWIIDRYTLPGDTIADPMAGIGSILLAAAQDRNVIAREIEPRWFELLRRNAEQIKAQSLFCGQVDIAQGDAREAWGYNANHVVFSPPYGCEFSASTPNSRRGYLPAKEAARAANTDGNYSRCWKELFMQGENSGVASAQIFHYGSHHAQLGHLTGTPYWAEMARVYRRAHEALLSGYMVLVIKDHIRKGERVHVCDQTIELCEQIGFTLFERQARLVYPLSLWQRRRKERGEPVVEDEEILAFRKAQA